MSHQVPKSLVLFDVKIYDMEVTSLDELTARILALEIEGLVWHGSPKQLDIAFGMKKLQVGCMIEDNKVSVDNIVEKI